MKISKRILTLFKNKKLLQLNSHKKLIFASLCCFFLVDNKFIISSLLLWSKLDIINPGITTKVKTESLLVLGNNINARTNKKRQQEKITALKANQSPETLTILEEFTITGIAPEPGDWNSPIMTLNDIIYVTYLDVDDNIWVAQKKPGKALTKTKIFDSVIVRQDSHLDGSIAIDAQGYIHVVGNVHNAPLYLHKDNPYKDYAWQYWVSTKPHNIERFEFMGDDPNRSIPGYKISYPFFASDNNNDLYIAFRGSSGFTKDLPGQGAGQIARYDIKTKTWEALGEQVGNIYEGSTKSVIWEEAGVPDLVERENTNGSIGYQGYKPRLYFDHNNWMHLTYVVNNNNQVNPYIPTHRGVANTTVLYGISKDGGETFTTADGRPILLPMTSATADLVFHTETPSIYNLNHLAVDSDGNPLITWTERTEQSKNLWSWWDAAKQVWQDPILNPAGGWMGRVLIDSEDVLTALAEQQIFRSTDQGQTGQRYSIPGMSITRGKFDYKYFQETSEIRLFVQSEAQGADSTTIRVLTLDFSE